MLRLSDKILVLGRRFFTIVGKNNKPTYPVIAVATANGIFKPISSLTDKKEKPQARKYAALREFCTEFVAVPTYWACGAGAAKLGDKLFKENPQKRTVARANMMFLGVCSAAFLVIPAVCSFGLKVLDAFKKSPKRDEPAKLNSAVQNIQIERDSVGSPKFGAVSRPQMNTFVNRGGLKI